ncbi:MAG: phosphatase PAP2 family protein [Nanoarchaeota archaeon]
MRNKRGIFLFIVAVASIFASLQFDSEISKAVSNIRVEQLNNFFLGLTFWSSEIIIFFLLTSFFLWNENKRRWIAPLWLTLFLSVVASFLLKISVQRMRPFQQEIVSTLPILISNSYTIWNFAFPSFQAMLVFCAIPILSKEFPKFKYAWIIFAALVAFSRVYFGLHFASDVIAGGLIGYVIGMLVVMYEKENRFGEKVYKKIFRK